MALPARLEAEVVVLQAPAYGDALLTRSNGIDQRCQHWRGLPRRPQPGLGYMWKLAQLYIRTEHCGMDGLGVVACWCPALDADFRRRTQHQVQAEPEPVARQAVRCPCSASKRAWMLGDERGQPNHRSNRREFCRAAWWAQWACAGRRGSGAQGCMVAVIQRYAASGFMLPAAAALPACPCA